VHRRINRLASIIGHAGGDYVSGKVSGFTGSGGDYSFMFAADRTLVGFEACRVFKIQVTYQRVPWFSWLPFVHTNHPTREQTNVAAAALKQAAETDRPALFGYLGSGLVASGVPCTFKSKGLSLNHDSGNEFVLSFHDQA
jgi:hypothetical protein